MENNYNLTQNIFLSLERLAALCATQGVDEKTKELANKQMQELLGLLQPLITKMSVQSMGIVTQ